MNEAGDIQITIGFDTTTSSPPVVQQRHCSAVESNVDLCAAMHQFDHDNGSEAAYKK